MFLRIRRRYLFLRACIYTRDGIFNAIAEHVNDRLLRFTRNPAILMPEIYTAYAARTIFSIGIVVNKSYRSLHP